MNDEREYFETERDGADDALEAIRRAERVDFALRIAQSLQADRNTLQPLALAFQETVSRVESPESQPGDARERDA